MSNIVLAVQAVAARVGDTAVCLAYTSWCRDGCIARTRQGQLPAPPPQRWARASTSPHPCKQQRSWQCEPLAHPTTASPHLQAGLARRVQQREQGPVLVALAAAAAGTVAEALQAAGAPGLRRQRQVVQGGSQRGAGQPHKAAAAQRGQRGAGDGVQCLAGLQGGGGRAGGRVGSGSKQAVFSGLHRHCIASSPTVYPCALNRRLCSPPPAPAAFSWLPRSQKSASAWRAASSSGSGSPTSAVAQQARREAVAGRLEPGRRHQGSWGKVLERHGLRWHGRQRFDRELGQMAFCLAAPLRTV